MSESGIRTRQIADGQITKEKIPAGAGLETSKLADGAEFIKRDGSVAMTGALNLGSQLITNVQTPSAGTDGANKNYVDTLIGGLPSAYKYRTVRARATANVNISNPGTDTFDGVTLTNGQEILLAQQTTGSQNGIYVFNGSGAAMTRAAHSDAWNEFPGSLVFVNEGTLYGDTRWQNTNDDGGTLGTTAVVYTQDVSNGLTAANFVDKEVPSGSINGSNAAFTLANTPVAGSEHVYLNGMLQTSGAGNDYTISGAVITMLTAPLAGERIIVSYRK